MERMLSQQSVECKSASNLSTLKDALEQLEINALAPEFVAAYKREKLEQITHRLLPGLAREITEEKFSCWERAELRRMCKNHRVDDRSRIRFFWDRRYKRSLLDLPGDAPVIRFWETLWGPLFYTCLRWVRLPLEEVRDAPEFVKAKAREIANLLPDASFTVEQLRSEKKYDPFLIVSYAHESYYVEVWEEPEFEQKYT